MTLAAIQKLHAEEVSTKWWQRQAACVDDSTTFQWLAELDRLIDANLDGLLEGQVMAAHAIEQAVDKALSRAAADASADCFTHVAFTAAIQGWKGLSKFASDPRWVEVVESYLAWSPRFAADVVEKCSQDGASPLHIAALKNLHVHGLPGDGLRDLLLKSRVDNIEAVLTAVQDCGRTDLLGWVRQIIDDSRLPEDSSIRYAAARCALLLGSSEHHLPLLRATAHGNTPRAPDAARLLSLSLAGGELARFVEALDSNAQPLLAVRCIGWGGYPGHVPLLLDKLQQPALASTVLQAFHQITGVNPESILRVEGEPSRQENKGLAARRRLLEWWQANGEAYPLDVPHLMGKPATAEPLRQALVTAPQGPRDAAALRLMLLNPGIRRFPTCAHVHLQWQRFIAMDASPEDHRQQPKDSM